MRKWWTKLEKDDHNGMSARKEYDAVGSDLMESGEYSMKQIARILLEKEKEKEARGVSKRMSDEDKQMAKMISKYVNEEEADMDSFEMKKDKEEKEKTDEEIEEAKKIAKRDKELDAKEEKE